MIKCKKGGDRKAIYVALLAIVLICGIANIFNHMYAALWAKQSVENEVELSPPLQNVDQWDPATDSNNHTLTFRISIREYDDKEYSKIFDFGILIVEKNPDGRRSVDVEPYLPDRISGIDYNITIDFQKLIGSKAIVRYNVQWLNASGKYEIPDAITQTYGIDGEVYMMLIDKKHAYIDGTIVFNYWAPDEYYLIVWCVDEYGNARIVSYNPGKNVSDPPDSTRYTALSGNIRGFVDPEADWKNYFYTLDGEPYVPYIRSPGGGYQGCFVLYLAPLVDVEFGGVVVNGSHGYWCLFILRFETLFGFGSARAGDRCIRFFVDVPLTGVFDCLLLLLLAVSIYYLCRRRD